MNMMKNKPKLWSNYYVYTILVSLIINTSSIMLITVLPLFTVSIGGNNSLAGLLTTILTASSLVFRPIFGKMIDTKGRKNVLIVGLSLFTLSTILLMVSSNIILLLLLRLIQGVGLSGFSTALATILSDIVPSSRLSEGVGYFGISGTIAMALGPSLGLYLVNGFGFQITYMIAFCIALSSVVLACLINYERKTGYSMDFNQEHRLAAGETAVASQNQLQKGFIEKSSIRPCIVMVFTVFAISAVFSFMPLFGKARNIENIGLFFTVYAITVILARLVTGKAADRFGFSKVYFPAITMTFLLFITLAFAHSLSAVLLAAVFYGIGYGTVQPIMNTIIIKLSAPERRGAANATYYATIDIGFGTGSFVWGAVSQIGGFTAVFLGGALCIAISGLAYFFILHPVLSEKQAAPSSISCEV